MSYKDLYSCRYIDIQVNKSSGHEPVGFGVSYRKSFYNLKWRGVFSIILWNRSIEIRKQHKEKK